MVSAMYRRRSAPSPIDFAVRATKAHISSVILIAWPPANGREASYTIRVDQTISLKRLSQNPKSNVEMRNKSEIRSSKPEPRSFLFPSFLRSDFGFVSHFDIGISDFP
jgi:hypothetical protein